MFAPVSACSRGSDTALNRVEVVAATVVFGNDDRTEAYALRDLGQLDLVSISRSTALLVDTADVRDGQPKLSCTGGALGTACDDTCPQCDIQWGADYATSDRDCVPGFAKCPDLCDDEPFRAQLLLGTCTGFLVGPDLLVTAGHCVAGLACARTAVVFGYELLRVAGSPEVVYKGLDTYHCREVVAAEYGEASVPDFALLRLHRPVSDRVALCVERTSVPAVGNKLVMAGHPMGLPLKVDTGGEVTKVDAAGRYFDATTDSFTGSSGAAVLDATTLGVVGILARGPKYAFEVADTEQCSRSRVCDVATGCGGTFPGVLRTDAWQAHVPNAQCYIPGLRCVDASSCAPGCACVDGSCAQGIACSGGYCETAQCAPGECRSADCNDIAGCGRAALPDCTAGCGGGSEQCVAGRCGDPGRDGFEDGMADYWSASDDASAVSRRPEWFVVDDQQATGQHALRVAPVGPGSEQPLVRNGTTGAGATVAFAFRISAGEGDRLLFEVDGALRASFRGGGLATWASVEFPANAEDGYLAAGGHTFVWRFRRGSGAPVGDNTVWLDDVVINRLSNACGCTTDAECLDSTVCNGVESCINGACVEGESTCADGLVCDAQFDACVECVEDADCGGSGRCMLRQCTWCEADADCDDADLCNGVERCVAGACSEAMPLECDDGQACNGVERCEPLSGCVTPTELDCQDPVVPVETGGASSADQGADASAHGKDAGGGQPAADRDAYHRAGCSCVIVAAHAGGPTAWPWMLLLAISGRIGSRLWRALRVRSQSHPPSR